MSPIFDRLAPWVCRMARRPVGVLAVALVATAVGAYLSSTLRIETDLARLLPSDYESVQALERLRETVGGESEAAVVIESPSFEANRRFAEDLIPRVLDLERSSRESSYFTRVDFRRETEFLQNNALYFATERELDSLEAYLRDEIERAKLEANPFYVEVESEDDSLRDARRADLLGAYRQIVRKEYPISDDSTTMVLRFYPSGAQTDIGFIEEARAHLERTIADLDPSTYHPGMETDLGGRLLRQLVEVRAITRDVRNSFGGGVTSVLLVVILYFAIRGYVRRRQNEGPWASAWTEVKRTPVTALVIGGPLLMSLAWTFGFAALVFGRLNLMTSTLGLVLFGLGIDYGIHFYARYGEERAKGRPFDEAVEATFVSTGQAVAISAMTTSAALYVLYMADFRGFSEFGVVAGTGILFALVAMVVVLPAVVSTVELIGRQNRYDHLERESTYERRQGRFPASRWIVGGSLAAVVAALVFLPRLSFEYDFSELEPDYEQYDEVGRKISTVYPPDNRRNPAYIVVEDPDRVPEVADALRAKMEGETDSSTILAVETLQERFPRSDSAQQSKLDRIAEIRSLLESPYLSGQTSEDLDRLRRAARTERPVPIDSIPQHLRAEFTAKDGTLGSFVMIYPSVGLSDARNSMAFAEEVGTVRTESGRVYHAGSTSLIAADMIRLLQREAPWMVGITALLIVALMLANFRSVRGAGLAVIPLGVGLLWMTGLLELFGLKFNFYNLVVIPAILGIGNDAGVHLVHRYREEGPGSIREVLRSSGEHVTMGSLTTMIGFSGLLFSYHPGLRSMGELAVLGIGATLAAAVLFLPALLQWYEDRTTAPGD